MWIPTAQEASSALFPRQDTSSQDPSNQDKDKDKNTDDGNKGPDWRVFTVVAIMVVLFVIVIVGIYAKLRKLRAKSPRPPKLLPGNFLKRKWQQWNPRAKGQYSAQLQENDGPTRRHRANSSLAREMEGMDTTAAPANDASANAAVNRNTSIRSVMTLPAYSPAVRENERILGREGDRAGIDVVVEFPETMEEEEEVRDREMESLYQIRVARRQEQAEREDRRRRRREARQRGDLETLAQLPARWATCQEITLVVKLAPHHPAFETRLSLAPHVYTYARANMSSAESKPTDPEGTAEATAEAVEETSKPEAAEQQDESSGDEEAPAASEGAGPAAAKKKKKKSKKKKLKEALIGTSNAEAGSSSSAQPKQQLNREQLEALLAANPALKAEFDKMNEQQVQELLKNLSVSDLLTGLTIGSKNAKDMASYKFWQTQPVPSFDDPKLKVEDGPIKVIDKERVSKDPAPLVEGFEWVTMNLEDEKELAEVYDLLTHHYVEDDEAMFRFNYSASFLNWALKAPGWRDIWHVGVRATQSRKLVAFISGIPVKLRVRKNLINSVEINFLCVHKKLRSKRLAPTLIKEITRRCYLNDIFQAIYTAGVILPTPVASCRYYHRSIDWEKLYDVGFSPLPHGSTRQRQVLKYKLPDRTSTNGLRPMEEKDCDQVKDLLTKYLARTHLAQEFSKEEVEHWFINRENDADKQVVWAYVVEDPSSGKITDFVSFYCLESTVIKDQGRGNRVVRAAYLYYYATEVAFTGDQKELKARLNGLIKDVLTLAKKAKFDVLNALTLLDNPLFLEEQKFGAGDGQLHYYLYNYRTALIPGGVNDKNLPSEKHMGGVGVVML
ncbi:putative peptide n-myristoyl transferase [Diplodia seriata]|uniref:Glycylpeptide N-tetradecanoyltransferase n=1 Tax=Diplodia seriata TaxID=420778 RepID=A0A0G2E931_9PEZI|nr:putative peptide n-myristoyl transferase [Diplodia seriata]